MSAPVATQQDQLVGLGPIAAVKSIMPAMVPFIRAAYKTQAEEGRKGFNAVLKSIVWKKAKGVAKEFNASALLSKAHWNKYKDELREVYNETFNSVFSVADLQPVPMDQARWPMSKTDWNARNGYSKKVFAKGRFKGGILF